MKNVIFISTFILFTLFMVIVEGNAQEHKVQIKLVNGNIYTGLLKEDFVIQINSKGDIYQTNILKIKRLFNDFSATSPSIECDNFSEKDHNNYGQIAPYLSISCTCNAKYSNYMIELVNGNIVKPEGLPNNIVLETDLGDISFNIFNPNKSVPNKKFQEQIGDKNQGWFFDYYENLFRNDFNKMVMCGIQKPEEKDIKEILINIKTSKENIIKRHK